MNKYVLTFIFVTLLFVSCSKKDDSFPKPTPTPNFSELEVEDFIWRGMNLYYFWKDDVSNLANSVADNEQNYYNLLTSESTSKYFFYNLCYQHPEIIGYNSPNIEDRWSLVVENYIDLENSLQGISTSSGLEYRLSRISSGGDDLIGWIRYVMPNSDASNENVARGEVFYGVNGKKLTVDNYKDLLIDSDSFTLNFADIVNNTITPNGKSIEFNKSEYQENPVFIKKVLDVENTKIGYLMYNSFNSSFDVELNAAFGELKSQNISELILDLRYNGGGSILTSTYLASLITGQFTGKLYAKEKWNAEIQEWFENNQPSWLENKFVDEIIKKDQQGTITVQESLNSLNLSKVYVIVTEDSASASELVINGLNAYIEVVLIGSKTHGKYTGSRTIYDSDNFSRTGANLNTKHTYAMQPIVLETVNANGVSIKGGIEEDYEVIEYIVDMKELGNEDEPLLAKTIELITGVTAKPTLSSKMNLIEYEKVFTSKQKFKYYNDMYTKKELPLNFK